jgi:hypothetical protein
MRHAPALNIRRERIHGLAERLADRRRSSEHLRIATHAKHADIDVFIRVLGKEPLDLVRNELLVRRDLCLLLRDDLFLQLLKLCLELALADEADIALAELLPSATSAQQRTVKNGFIAASLSLPVRPSMRVKRRSNSVAWRDTSCASWPVTATIRRIPLAIELSSVMTRSLIESVF